jgi:hypothetical protein
MKLLKFAFSWFLVNTYAKVNLVMKVTIIFKKIVFATRVVLSAVRGVLKTNFEL